MFEDSCSLYDLRARSYAALVRFKPRMNVHEREWKRQAGSLIRADSRPFAGAFSLMDFRVFREVLRCLNGRLCQR